jgi:polar amino acid transport system substrate-binding protein
MTKEIEVGSLVHDLDRRSLLTGAAVVGASAALVVEAKAQLLETGIPPDSVLTKIKKGGSLKVGFAQTPLWFFKEAKSGELRGVYKELVDMLARDLEMTVDWQEVTFANATVGLRRGDFDLFGSSAVYTVPRGLSCNFVGLFGLRAAMPSYTTTMPQNSRRSTISTTLT